MQTITNQSGHMRTCEKAKGEKKGIDTDLATLEISYLRG